jgi:hypothetical protein
MGPFLLILLTLDAHTGEPLDSKVIGDSYQTIKECLVAAIDQGPHKAVDSKATLVFCQEAGSRYTRTVMPVRDPQRDG